MISIKRETKKGTLVKLPPEEAEKVYQALRLLFAKLDTIRFRLYCHVNLDRLRRGGY